jgi:hypothetical protein
MPSTFLIFDGAQVNDPRLAKAGRKCMTYEQFHRNTSGVDKGFTHALLSPLYHSIKREPMEWKEDPGAKPVTVTPRHSLELIARHAHARRETFAHSRHGVARTESVRIAGLVLNVARGQFSASLQAALDWPQSKVRRVPLIALAASLSELLN